MINSPRNFLLIPQAVFRAMVSGAPFGRDLWRWEVCESYRHTRPDFATHLASARTPNQPTRDVIPEPARWRFWRFFVNLGTHSFRGRLFFCTHLSRPQLIIEPPREGITPIPSCDTGMLPRYPTLRMRATRRLLFILRSFPSFFPSLGRPGIGAEIPGSSYESAPGSARLL